MKLINLFLNDLFHAVKNFVYKSDDFEKIRKKYNLKQEGLLRFFDKITQLLPSGSAIYSLSETDGFVVEKEEIPYRLNRPKLVISFYFANGNSRSANHKKLSGKIYTKTIEHLSENLEEILKKYERIEPEMQLK